MKTVLLAILLAASTSVFAAQTATDKQQLQQLLQQTQSLSAQFQQRVKDEQGQLLQSLSGTLKLERPANLYWHTRRPDESVMVANGKTVWYYNPFVEQVTIYSQSDMVDNSPLLLVLDSQGQRWEDYTVQREGSRYIVEQVDNGNRLELVFEQQVLKEITMVQPHGQRTELTLNEVSLNQAIDDGTFEFEVPDGVDIDDQS
jgi:outer membrane lipoprotein carrier protein